MAIISLTDNISDATTGKNLSNKNTPAITSVAECIKALTGVGALIAFISQEFIGNCADFTIPATTNNITITEYI